MRTFKGKARHDLCSLCLSQTPLAEANPSPEAGRQLLHPGLLALAVIELDELLGLRLDDCRAQLFVLSSLRPGALCGEELLSLLLERGEDYPTLLAGVLESVARQVGVGVALSAMVAHTVLAGGLLDVDEHAGYAVGAVVSKQP